MGHKNSSRRKSKFESSTPDLIRLSPRTKSQEALVDSIHHNPITIAHGPAGVGKTLIALHEAIHLFHKRKIDEVIFIKPIIDVSFSKGIGFLPGTLEEKIDPLLAPVKDNLEVFVSPGKANQMIRSKQVSFGMMETLRGRSLRNKFIILDEAQNTTNAGILTVISRMEESSYLVICGDTCQKDTKTSVENGLLDATRRLANMREVGIVEFTLEDIQRAGFLKNVIGRYN